MKALSIRQPWASMIIQGFKPVENRSWKAKHRGPLLIHASKKWDHDGECWIKREFPHLVPEIEKARKLCGGIIGSVTMTDCVPDHPSPWYAGEWAFVVTDPRPMDFIPYKGQLQFFNVSRIKTWEELQPQAAKGGS